jgi:Protein of unknown function (DUF2970)
VSVARAFKAVAWSFFGVRKGSEYERDVAELKPGQVIVVGIVCAVLFVLALVAVVKWVVGSGVAAG